jgi:hypothetical protein
MKLIPAGDLKSAEPVLAVRWCISRAESQTLKKRQAENVHVLFVIKYEDTNLEDRSLVPIDQAMTYLNFRRPGNHIVFAIVLWSQSIEYLNARCLSKSSRREYEYTVLNHEKNDLRPIDYFKGRICRGALEETEEIEVTVPSEHFPPEPSEWLKSLVNSGFEYAPVDQCQFRRRMLWLPLKIPAFLTWAIVTTILRAILAFFLLFPGMRDIDWHAVVHPWKDDLRDVVVDVEVGNSWFNVDAEDNLRSRWFFFLRPIVWLVIFAVATFLKVLFHVTYWQLLIMGLMTAAKLVVIVWNWLLHILGAIWKVILSIAFGIGLLIVAYRAWMKWEIKKEKQMEALEKTPDFQEQQQRAREKAYDELYKLLACKPNITPDVSNLPSRRQTLRLRYLDLKAKVCRPYAAR